MSKFRKRHFGMDDEDDFETQYDEETENNQEDIYEEPAFVQSRARVVTPIPQENYMDSKVNMVIYKPTEYEQAQTIIDFLKTNKPIVVNLDEIDIQVAQRILDFITGGVYALGGDIKKAARNIFVVVPSNVGLSDEVETQAAPASFEEETGDMEI